MIVDSILKVNQTVWKRKDSYKMTKCNMILALMKESKKFPDVIQGINDGNVEIKIGSALFFPYLQIKSKDCLL